MAPPDYHVEEASAELLDKGADAVMEDMAAARADVARNWKTALPRNHMAGQEGAPLTAVYLVCYQGYGFFFHEDPDKWFSQRKDGKWGAPS